ncbi:hypothetical protein [Undibacterium sp.]|uniref:hypothetical protein n=1 Tax=Undibacterium sp. TaxID=1914977 RepID=UPI0025FBC4BE|nr:hypothetical protein [Undibacterium sp.]
MDQLCNYSDSRLLHGCIYCDQGLSETRDHVPSKVFLDTPYPENLAIVPACFNCNNGFSRDEEYVACLLESVIVGSIAPSKARRESIAKTLRRNQPLCSMIAAGMSESNGQTVFKVQNERVQNIALKLARGHAAFEFGMPFRSAPAYIQCEPMSAMPAQAREQFEDAAVPTVFGEIGSRSMQRLQVMEVMLRSQTGEQRTHTYFINTWVDVQEGRYRYLATNEEYGVRVRIVIGEYLAFEVRWEN